MSRSPAVAAEIANGSPIPNQLFSSEAEAKLKAKAAAAGVDITTFATRTLERMATRPSLDEVLAPLFGMALRRTPRKGG